MSEEKVENGLSQEEIEKIAKSRTWEYSLKWPIELGNTTHSNLTLKRFKTKHIKAINKVKDQAEQGAKMVQISTGLSELEVDEIDAVDFTKIIEICAVFMDASQN
jgi:hypothetical protein